MEQFFRLSSFNLMKVARHRGYFVTEEGKFFTPSGERPIISQGNRRYPRFTLYIYEDGRRKSKTVNIHQFAAYCHYGVEAFIKPYVIVNLSRNYSDCSKQNLKLGLHSTAQELIPAHIKIKQKELGIALRKSQPKEGVSAKLSWESVHYIRNKAFSNRYLSGKYPKYFIENLAKEFSVTKVAIYQILKNKYWGLKKDV